MMFNNWYDSSHDNAAINQRDNAAVTENNFGACEWCGACAPDCACFSNDCSHGEGWLERALEDLLDGDQQFNSICNNEATLCNSGIPLCTKTTPLGLDTDGPVTHPVCIPVGSLYNADRVCSVQCSDVDRDQCRGHEPMQRTEPDDERFVYVHAEKMIPI